jgi:hypothetical protein
MATVMNTRKVFSIEEKVDLIRKKKDTLILVVREAVETIRVANRTYEARSEQQLVSQIVHIEGHLESQGSAGSRK